MPLARLSGIVQQIRPYVLVVDIMVLVESVKRCSVVGLLNPIYVAAFKARAGALAGR